MTPLEEAHLEIFGYARPGDMSEEKLAQLVLEGLSKELHGRDLMNRCSRYIFEEYSDRFSDLVKWWARRDFDPEVTA